jgi:hypothetical protein
MATPRKKFRVVVGILFVVVAVLLIFQYSSRPLFATGRTSTLWGFLVGLAIAGVYFDRMAFGRARTARAD